MPQPGDAQPGDCLGEVKISHSHTIHATGIYIYIYLHERLISMVFMYM